MKLERYIGSKMALLRGREQWDTASQARLVVHNNALSPLPTYDASLVLSPSIPLSELKWSKSPVGSHSDWVALMRMTRLCAGQSNAKIFSRDATHEKAVVNANAEK